MRTMARKPRIDYAGAIQHVAVNGNNRQPMFLEDRDRIVLLALLRGTAERYGWEVWSFCLMDTHWHAVVRTPLQTLSLVMKRLNSCYSRTFNRLHERSGHSIRHKFMSVPVENDGHLRELTRYLPLNPVRAGLSSHPEDWGWSSYRAEIGAEDTPSWLHAGWSVGLHGSAEALRRFVAEGMAEPGAHWTPGSDPTITPRRQAARTAPQHPAWA
jgi:putative transposase